MPSHPLVFFFYQARTPWREDGAISRGMRVMPGPGEEYGRNFLSLWFELPTLDHTLSALRRLAMIENGEMAEMYFGGKQWEIHVTRERVVFTNHQFENWNDGQHNIMPLHEFRHAILAWHSFLSLPEEPANTEYSFAMPDGATPPTLRRLAQE